MTPDEAKPKMSQTKTKKNVHHHNSIAANENGRQSELTISNGSQQPQPQSQQLQQQSPQPPQQPQQQQQQQHKRSPQEIIMKRNSTTVPPVMHHKPTMANEHIVYRLVLTGGPCSGKTTGQARLSTFFENLGWKVYRVPETATTLFSGGIRFPEMNQEQKDKFQENLIKVMIAMERTFFTLAATCDQNCLVICDRGIMDATAYMPKEVWEKVLKTNGWNAVELRDNRYNQVIHLVTSADGAEEYYNCEDNPCRTESVEVARELDRNTLQAWVGHPYIDVLDNTTDFDTKMRKMVAAVCRRIGIVEAKDRLKSSSKKTKYLVAGPLPADSVFPTFQDFDVVHDYLITSTSKIQSRLRKRGQSGNWSYQHTVRRSVEPSSQQVELRRQISHRDYVTMLAQRDDAHHTVYKKRRCFLWEQIYFQLDIYQMSNNVRCGGLMLLETYTTLTPDELKCKLPPFLTVVREVTNEKEYSMHQLSLKSENCYSTHVHAIGGFDTISCSHHQQQITKNQQLLLHHHHHNNHHHHQHHQNHSNNNNNNNNNNNRNNKSNQEKSPAGSMRRISKTSLQNGFANKISRSASLATTNHDVYNHHHNHHQQQQQQQLDSIEFVEQPQPPQSPTQQQLCNGCSEQYIDYLAIDSVTIDSMTDNGIN